MILSINQPAFVPWLGYFHRIAISDMHVVLDHVQFEKNSYTNRNKIRASDGTFWITIPLITSGRFGDLSIMKVEIAKHTNWKRKVLQSIMQNYQKASYFNNHYPFIEEAVNRDWTKLNDILRYTNEYLLKELNITTPIIYSSDLEIEGTKGDLVLNICKKLKATDYISGPFGKDYLNKEEFINNNIVLSFHEYKHPEYRQNFNGFISHLSILDLLFNEGPEAKTILLSNQSKIY